MDSSPLKICRICLNNTSDTIEFREFVEGEHLTYMEIFNLCTHLDAYRDDELPKNICRYCKEELKQSFFFLRKANKADKYFRQQIELKTTEGDIAVNEEAEREAEEARIAVDSIITEMTEKEDEKNNDDSGTDDDETNSHDSDLELIIPSETNSNIPYGSKKNADNTGQTDNINSRNIKVNKRQRPPSNRVDCPHCGADVSRRYLRKHIQVRHLKNGNYKCTQCNYSTGYRDYFKNHVQRKHKGIAKSQFS